MSNYRDKIANRKQAGFYKPADINGEEAEVSHAIALLSQDEEHYGRKSDVLHFGDTPKYLRLSTFNAEILMEGGVARETRSLWPGFLLPKNFWL
jgi:hypothetical protein